MTTSSDDPIKEITERGFEFHQRFRGRSGKCYLIASKRTDWDYGDKKCRIFFAFTKNVLDEPVIKFIFSISRTALGHPRVREYASNWEKFLTEAGLHRFTNMLLQDDSIGDYPDFMIHSKSSAKEYIIDDPEHNRKEIQRVKLELLDLLWENFYQGVKKTDKRFLQDKICTKDTILDSVLNSFQQRGFIKGGLSSDNIKITPEGEDELEKLRNMVERKEVQTREISINSEMDKEYDVFVSHAWEDKEPFVRELAEGLSDKKLRVWYDDFSLKLGNSLRESIDQGLSKSKYGVVVLSKNFFNKQWAQKELNALFGKMEPGKDIILPVWHEISAEEIRQYSPLMADIVGVKSSEGVENVIKKIVDVVKN